MILIYCGKSISGAHYNPAVTISIYYRGYCNKRELQYYVFFQLIGSVTASILYYYLIIPTNANYEIFELNMSASISEFIFTFLLVSVILNVATLDATKGNYYYGKGKLVYPYGEIYEGDFKDGLRDGAGIFIDKKGDKYEGYYKDDLMHGEFTIFYKNGQIEKGKWTNGFKAE